MFGAALGLCGIVGGECLTSGENERCMEFSSMTTSNNTSAVVSGAADREQFISEQIEAAWEHVCLGFSANLLTLLVETRRRGLTDAEVKDYLQENESEHDEDFRGWRSGSGEPFLARNEGSFDTVASVNELFQELAEDGELQDADSDLGVLSPAERIRAIALKAADEESHVYRISCEMKEACPELERAGIIEIVQGMIDADVICIAFDEEDWLTFYRCVQPGEVEDTEAVYFTALEAFTEAERRWDLSHGELTEPEKHLLGIMRKISRSGVVVLSDLSEALRKNGLTVEAAWPVVEMLADRYEISFERSIGGRELYLLLQDVRVETVNQHIALPELKACLESSGKPVATVGHPPAFVLSRTVETLGHELTETQAIVLDVAQVIRREFMKRASVLVTDLLRVTSAYHGIGKQEARKAIAEMVERGILIESRSEAGTHYSIKLAFKLRGLAADEVTPDCMGVGSLIVPAVQDPPLTLRERCESLQYRQDLSERFKLSGAICSVEAAMVLTAINERAGIDQTDLGKLYGYFSKNGFTDVMFKAACEELSALDAIEIFRSRHSQLVVRMRRVVDSAERLNVAHMFGSLRTKIAEVVEAA